MNELCVTGVAKISLTENTDFQLHFELCKMNVKGHTHDKCEK